MVLKYLFLTTIGIILFHLLICNHLLDLRHILLDLMLFIHIVPTSCYPMPPTISDELDVYVTLFYCMQLRFPLYSLILFRSTTTMKQIFY